jgi:hypothetical protein
MRGMGIQACRQALARAEASGRGAGVCINKCGNNPFNGNTEGAERPAAGTAATAKKLRIALIGPHANSTEDLLGYSDYHAQNDAVASGGSVLQILQQWDANRDGGLNLNEFLRMYAELQRQ